jgi:hypothetical protein
MRDLGAGTQSRPDISWSSGVTAVVQWASALDNGNVIPKRRDASWLQDQEQCFLKGPPDATQSLWQVRALDFQGMGKSSAMGQEPTHTIRPASCRCRPIAVSFHRLFLGGLLPSRARFRFAGYVHGIRSNPSRQGHASGFYTCRQNSPPPLDSAHISCRLAATRKSSALGQEVTPGSLARWRSPVTCLRLISENGRPTKCPLVRRTNGQKIERSVTC